MKNRPLCWAALLFVCMIFLTRDMRTEKFASGQTVTLCAVVYQYEKKETSTAVYLKDCVLQASNLSENQKLFSESVRCLAYIKESDNIKIGATLTIQGTIQLFQKPSNEGQFSEEDYYKGQGVDFKLLSATVLELNQEGHSWLQLLCEVRETLHNRLLTLTDQSTAGILQAMLLGEKGSVNMEEKELFQDASIGHILVVSGLHFSIAGLGVYKLLRKIAGIKIAGMSSIVLLFFFGLMTGFGSSAVRAFVMFVMYVLAQMAGRDYDLQTGLFVAVMIILWRNPDALFLAGFLLSVSAVLGIALFVPVIQNLCSSKWKFLNAASASFGIQLFSLPISLYYYFEMNPYSMFINACVLPFLSFIVVDAALALAVSFVWNSLGWLLLRPTAWMLKAILFICEGVRQLPFAALILGRPRLWQMLVYYLLLFILALVVNKRCGQNDEKALKCKKGLKNRKFEKKIYSCLCFLLPLIFLLKNKPEFRLTMLDVGQGQCFYAEEKGGLRLLYDGGSTDVKKAGQYRIEPFLKAIGCASLDLAIVSHLDEDHISGIVELLESEEIKIKMLVMPNTMLKDDAFDNLYHLTENKGVKVQLFGNGDVWKSKHLILTGLHPELSYVTDSRNDASIVMRLEYKEFTALFCGDMESGAEQKLLRQGLLSDCDMLQVAHHGSKYSTTEAFLEAVRPEISFISCGKDNRYGHPHQELLQRLEQSGTTAFISEQSGAVTIEMRKGKLKLYQMIDPTGS